MAGKAIQGITLEINGNSTKLVDALDKPKTKSKELQASLKDVNGALRFDTKNVDLLDQKQRLLSKTISSNEDELKLLKEAQKQYIESGKDIDGQEYIELEAKIAATEKTLERLKKQQTNFSAETQAMGIKIGEFGEKTESLGKKFMPVTAGITGIGVAATAAWSELDDAYDAIAAGTGATGDALKDLQKSFDNVYGDFPAESSAVGTAIADLNTRFGFTGKQLEDCSGQFLKFAQVNGTDVSSAIALVSRAMGDAGVESSQYASVLDALTSASQASGLSVDKLADSLTKYGAPMRALGFEMEESIALFAQWEKAGVNTEIAFSGMKKAISNWGKEGKNAKDEFQKTLKAIESAPSIADATSLAIEAFGAKAGPDLADAIKGGRFSVEEMTAAVEKSGGIVDQTFSDMLDPADKINVALNNLKIAGADLGAAIQSAVAPMLDKMAESCKKLAQWFKGLDDAQKGHIVQLGLLVAAIGPTLIGVGKMATGVSSLIQYFNSAATVGGKLIGFFKNMGGVTNVLKAGFSTLVSPIGLAVGAIAGLVAAFATLWNTNEEFRAKIIGVWNEIVSKFHEFFQKIVDKLNELGFQFSDISEVIKAVWQELCDFLAPIFEGVWAQIGNVITTALDMIMGLIDAFSELLSGNWSGFWDGIKSVFEAFWNGVGETVQNALDILTGVLDVFFGWFGTDFHTVFDGLVEWWNGLWQGIGDFFSGVWQGIIDFVSPILEFFNSDFQTGFAMISEWWTPLWQGISDFFSQIWTGILAFAQPAIDFFNGDFHACFDDLAEWWSGVWQGISDFFGGIWDGVRGIVDPVIEFFNGDFKACFDGLAEWWNGLWQGIGDFFGGIWQGIQDAASTVLGWFGIDFQNQNQSAAQNFNSTWDGAKEKLAQTNEGMRSNTFSVWDMIKNSLSGTWENLKATCGSAFENIKNSISEKWNSVKSTTASIWEGVKGSLSSTWENLKSTGARTFDNIKNSISEKWEQAKSTTSSIWEGIKGSLSGTWNNVKGLAGSAFDGVKNTISGSWSGVNSSTTSAWRSVSNTINSQTRSIQSAVRSAFSSIKSSMSTSMSSIGSSATRAFSSMQSSISRSMSSATSAVRNGVRQMVNAYSSARFYAPHIPVPHFYQYGYFDPESGSVPHYSVSWYRKAMEAGMILNGATIFGMLGGQLLGGGESGAEAVVGVNSLRGMIRDGMDHAFQRNLLAFAGPSQPTPAQQSAPIDYDRLARAVVDGLAGTTITHVTEIDGRPVAKTIAPLIDAELDKRSRRR
ncbi:phage tail tape measure protein [uncultured Dubosiella sp.]|uniref:phage tail tape measure protein n=2 Tax=uncultured Dubosiella sp. TaxID=1937011 RepID=UPI00272DF74D|nr:phage tail tape measure protein [uncultured Dubosiella sp.]